MIRDTSSQDTLLDCSAERRRVRRWLFAAIVAAATIALLSSGARRWNRAERSVASQRIRIAEVGRGKFVRDILVEGRVTAANNPTLYAVAAGTVAFRVQAGDAARRGQALAEITSPELSSRLARERTLRAGLEVEVGRAKLGVQQGRAGATERLDAAQLDRQTARREFERFRLGFSERVVPELELLRAEDSLHKAEILLVHAQSDRQLSERALGFELRTRELALARQRDLVRELEVQLDALVIRSPVDGQVGQLLVDQSAIVPPNAPVLRVVDLTAFELQIAVPDSFARDLAIGMPAEIGRGKLQYRGRVRSVAPEVVGGEVASRLEFVGEMPEGLRQNQRLSARILLDEREDVLSVERGPFLESGGGHGAYFVRDGVAERRPLLTGAASLSAVEILSGAAPGDRIVISGADAFGDAERVRIPGD
jgi:HlyD family secretion protein